MKGIFKSFKRSQTVLLCLACLMLSVQSLAHEEEDKVLIRTTDEKNMIEKKQKCEERCKASQSSQVQKNNHKNDSLQSDKQNSKMSNMSPAMQNMDHTQMKMPQHKEQSPHSDK